MSCPYLNLNGYVMLGMLKKNTSTLRAYGGQVLYRLGETELNCIVDSQSHPLKFFIVQGESATLLGINTCHDQGLVSFGPAVHQVSHTEDSTQQILSQYKELFDNELGMLPLKCNIAVDPNITPVV